MKLEVLLVLRFGYKALNFLVIGNDSAAVFWTLQLVMSIIILDKEPKILLEALFAEGMLTGELPYLLSLCIADTTGIKSAFLNVS